MEDQAWREAAFSADRREGIAAFNDQAGAALAVLGRPAPMTDHPTQLPQPVELPVAERESALPLRAQLIRFVITGGLSAVVDFGLLVILMQLGPRPHRRPRPLSFVAGTTTAYLINRRWTFRAAPSTRRFLAVVRAVRADLRPAGRAVQRAVHRC